MFTSHKPKCLSPLDYYMSNVLTCTDVITDSMPIDCLNQENNAYYIRSHSLWFNFQLDYGAIEEACLTSGSPAASPELIRLSSTSSLPGFFK